MFFIILLHPGPVLLHNNVFLNVDEAEQSEFLQSIAVPGTFKARRTISGLEFHKIV